MLDAFGIDRILVETVGVGQSELDIARTVDTSVVVLAPESGDSIQTLKAGLMEIADLFVVNKADRPGADRLRNDLELMLGLRGGARDRRRGRPPRRRSQGGDEPGQGGARPRRADDDARWTPPVLRCVGTTGEGVPELLAALDRHFGYLERSGALLRGAATRLRERVVDVAEQRVRRRLWTDGATAAWIDERIPELESGATTPYAVADALLARSGELLAGAKAMTGFDEGSRACTSPARTRPSRRCRRSSTASAARWPSGARRSTARPSATSRSRTPRAKWRRSTPRWISRARPARRSRCRERIRSRAASTPRAIAAGSGRCASSPASARARETNERYKFLLAHGQTGLSVAFDFPTLMGYDSDHPRSEGEVGKCGVAISSLADMETLFDGHPARRGLDVDDDQRARRSSSGASTSRRRRSRACSAEQAPRHGAERHPEGVHGAARLVLPDRAGAAPDRRHVRVGRRARAAVEHDLDLRLPHPRGRRDGGAGARVHARRRLHLRRARHRARARRSTTSRRGSRSSGTSTTTSSRRSPSCARRAASGRAT